MDKFHFFYRGPLSQWAKSFFTLEDVRYNCAEQYMMAQKALLFQDLESYKSIMEYHCTINWLNNPKTYKKMGRQVKNYVETIWRNNARDIVYKGNLAKFTQNLGLQEYLLNTEGELVEASPVDKIWGIGLSISSPLVYDRNNWLGTNWLGEVLTKVREELRNNHE